MRIRHFAVLCAALVLLPQAARAQGVPARQPAAQAPAAPKRPPAVGFSLAMAFGQDQKPSAPQVTLVVPGSNAERAGLQVGDVLLSVNGRDMSQLPWFPVRDAGTKYVLRVQRGKTEKELHFVYPKS